MILTNDLLAEELLTTFTVVKVRFEPHAESEWTLQFDNCPPITYFDKCFDTREEDEKLVGKRIKAQIDLEVNDRDITPITDSEEQKKSINYVSTGSIVVTGIYFEDSKEVDPKYDNERIRSCLDSMFKFRVLENLGGKKCNYKKGDWVRIKTSERCIILARNYMPLKEESSIKI